MSMHTKVLRHYLEVVVDQQTSKLKRPVDDYNIVNNNKNKKYQGFAVGPGLEKIERELKRGFKGDIEGT